MDARDNRLERHEVELSCPEKQNFELKLFRVRWCQIFSTAIYRLSQTFKPILNANISAAITDIDFRFFVSGIEIGTHFVRYNNHLCALLLNFLKMVIRNVLLRGCE